MAWKIGVTCIIVAINTGTTVVKKSRNSNSCYYTTIVRYMGFLPDLLPLSVVPLTG